MNENFCKSLAKAVGSKKVVIYGAGHTGATMLNLMDMFGNDVLFFIDQSLEKKKNGLLGYAVKAPEDILYEDLSEAIVVISSGDVENEEMENVLLSLGLVKGEEFINLADTLTEPTDCIDPFLGYGRLKYPKGFKSMGNYDENNKNIICLGGSTTDYAIYEIKSWPECFFELLEADKVPINVLNGGVSGYTSSQELLKLIRDGLETTPSLVISYSGTNDFLNATPILGNRYLYKIWEYIEKVIADGNVSSVADAKNLKVSYGAKSNLSMAEYWYRNEMMMCNICHGFNIPFLGILQPTVFTKSVEKYTLYEERALRAVLTTEYTTEQFKKAKRLVNEGQERNIVDFTSLFDQYDDVYVDACHVFEKGNRIIAEAVYRTIKEKGLLNI